LRRLGHDAATASAISAATAAHRWPRVSGTG
jgi:hypothetical protein